MNTKVFTVATVLFLILGLGGCDQIVPVILTEPEENDFVGVWTIHSVDGQPFNATQGQPLADSFSVWTFSPGGQFELILGWTPAPNEQGVFDVPQFYFRIEGTYALTGSRFSLTAGQSIGFLDTGDDEDVGGTWVREGVTLTLTGDDGTVLVLKEKL